MKSWVLKALACVLISAGTGRLGTGPLSPFPCAGLGEQAGISKQLPADLTEVMLVAPLRGLGQFEELSACLDAVTSSVRSVFGLPEEAMADKCSSKLHVPESGWCLEEL